MSDNTMLNNADGECMLCGTPGILGMHCSDSECSGEVVGMVPAKEKADGDVDRYEDDLMSDEGTISLEAAAEKEEQEEEAVAGDW